MIGERLALCYKIEQQSDLSRYIISPTNEQILTEVFDGSLPLRDAVLQPWLWIVETKDDDNFNVVRSWAIESCTIPELLLPKIETSLFFKHRKKEPYLSIKFCGGQIRDKLIPFSTIKLAVENVYGSLLTIFSSATRRVVTGVPESRIRRAITIPTHEFAHASLLIAIEKPEVDLAEISAGAKFDAGNIHMDEIITHIDRANHQFISAASLIADRVENNRNIEDIASDHLQALEAIIRIMPGRHGFFDSIEINGQAKEPLLQPAVIRRRDTKLLRDAYALASGSRREITGEVFLINGHSHQFTMAAGDRNVTCVATTQAQRDQIDLLQKGDRVFVRGDLTERQQRDLLHIHVMRVNSGVTVT
jgi:hypothetical protein